MQNLMKDNELKELRKLIELLYTSITYKNFMEYSEKIVDIVRKNNLKGYDEIIKLYNINKYNRRYNIDLNRNFSAVLNSNKLNELTLIKNIDINLDDIILFASCRNEINKLDKFFEHYENLGIKQFIIIDNNSNDGSFEYLKNKSNVLLYFTKHSYRKSRFGMEWINALISEYKTNNWKLVVDIDELFVYYNYENISIHEYSKQLESENYDMASGTMIDMIPINKNINEDKSINFDDCNYFYNSFFFINNYLPPYTITKGGLYNSISPSFLLHISKCPFFKSNDLKFLVSTHYSTPLKTKINGCCLLHYKYIGEFKDKFIDEIARSEHALNSKNYKHYIKITEENYFQKVLNPELLTKYINSQQLLDLNLLVK